MIILVGESASGKSSIESVLEKEYGYKKDVFKLNGQLLHAKTLGFIHPSTGEKMSFSVELPDYFKSVLEKIKNQITL